VGSEELLAKIRSDALKRVEETRAERDERVAAVRRQAEEETARLEQESREKTGREAGMILERARSRARLERRKMLLAAKWEVIERVFEAAKGRVRKDPEYAGLLKGIVERHAGGDSEVRVSNEDRNLLGGVKNLGEPVDIAAGVIVVQGRKSLDFSVGEALAAIRTELAPELSRDLFPAQEKPAQS